MQLQRVDLRVRVGGREKREWEKDKKRLRDNIVCECVCVCVCVCVCKWDSKKEFVHAQRSAPQWGTLKYGLLELSIITYWVLQWWNGHNPLIPILCYHTHSSRYTVLLLLKSLVFGLQFTKIYNSEQTVYGTTNYSWWVSANIHGYIVFSAGNCVKNNNIIHSPDM